MQVVFVPSFFVVSQSVMHLNSACRVADVVNLVLSSLRLDCRDIGFIIFAHIRPREVPVLFCCRSSGVICRMALAVLSASIVSDPNVVALIGKEEWKGLQLDFSICEPFGDAILSVAVLEED